MVMLLAAVLVADSEYPQRPAFGVLTKVLETFASKIPQSYYSNPSSIDFPDLKGFLDQYQDPSKADTIMRLQQELDDTKIILHQTIDSVLARGEKLDNLVERSNALNASSKRFYRTAKAVSSSLIADPLNVETVYSKTRAVLSCNFGHTLKNSIRMQCLLMISFNSHTYFSFFHTVFL